MSHLYPEVKVKYITGVGFKYKFKVVRITVYWKGFATAPLLFITFRQQRDNHYLIGKGVIFNDF